MTSEKAKSLANDISNTISTLQAIADELLTAYKSSDYGDNKVTTAGTNEPSHSQQDEPKTKPALTLEEVRAVLAEKSRDGHTAAIRGLLEKYGGTKLSEIDQSHYAKLMKEAEGLE